MSSDSRAKALVNAIFGILKDIVKKDSQLSKNVKNIEDQITQDKTLQQIQQSEIQRYEAQIKKIVDKKIDPGSINTDGWK